MPDSGAHLWEWYFDLSHSLRRVRDGICEPFPPSEFVAWKTAKGETVYPYEYEILRAMDHAYCEEMNKELADYREREKERREQEAKARRRGVTG